MIIRKPICVPVGEDRAGGGVSCRLITYLGSMGYNI